MSANFGLDDALGEDGMAELMRTQREIARRWWKFDVVDRCTAWLVEHGYEEQR
jgi:hypothetical protein